jgi:hypothetical protein
LLKAAAAAAAVVNLVKNASYTSIPPYIFMA